jgi:hypothetical protein
VVGVIVNLRMVTTAVTSTTQALVQVLLDLSHNNGHLVFLTKEKTHDVSLLKKTGSTVVEYFEWVLPKVLSQGGAELLSTLITEGSLQSRMWSSPTETLIAKGSSQNLVWSSTTWIVSHYMTLFLVLHHERVRYCNGLLKPRQ